MPQEWVDDPKRCERAGIPKEERKLRTNPELALELVQDARKNGLRFGWVGADAGYGKNPGFCFALDKMGKTFCVDVHSDIRVYLEDPKPYLPQKKNKSGRPFTKYRSDRKGIEVRNLVKSLPAQRWKTITLRKTTRGTLRVRACGVKIYIWDGETDKVKFWTLIVTKLKRLGWMQRQRFWVERPFEDAKSECGMADYQVRKWIAWHHHMALVMMTTLFMLSERIYHKDLYPLLSCADIENLLVHFLPRRDVTEEQVIFQLEQRHHQHQKAVESLDKSQERELRIGGEYHGG